MTDERGHPLEKFREYLAVLARQQVRGRLGGKVDLSGVVQQTLLEAHQAYRQLEPLHDAQKAAWLRQALANNLADEFRKLATGKRDADRECSLQAALEQSASRLEGLLAADQSTPSRQVQRAELMVHVARALEQLPDAQRQAIELHHLRGLPLADVAAALDSTRPAVAGLIHRGLKKLRRLLAAAGAGE
jgi:RNA polymerase sigma-70 factor (ECF subfamily)